MAFPLNQLAPQSQQLSGVGTFLQTPKYTQEQSQIMSNLAQLGAQNTDFGPIENRARKQFYGETIPGLAERFTAMGGSGQRSSAFQGALGQAGSDLESNLAAQRAGFGLQQLELGLQPQYESLIQPQSPGFGANIGGGLGQALPGIAQLAGNYLLGGKGGQPQPQAQQPASGIGSALGQVAGAAAPAVGGALASGGISSALSGLGTGLAAAAPFALPAAAALGVVGLPLLLSYLLE